MVSERRARQLVPHFLLVLGLVVLGCTAPIVERFRARAQLLMASIQALGFSVGCVLDLYVSPVPVVLH